MNYNEFMNKPNHLTFEEYEKLIEQRNKLKKQLTRICNKIYDEDDALSVFETGEAGYYKHLTNKMTLETKQVKILKKLEKINKLLEV